ncbi:arsenate reductase ArsC [Prolixibacter sp. SD074]|jgi:protein-tyrosine-phosphatase|uniref:arsenate reductase/protein-tyrosine-phosphatase family protein n=1 Tax=Prolixibacter sp. SD074 TaxID=2652391 RepID=UPI00127811A0|nr:arsenate reductase ArsC [Prolixibacter sp. SD074]GET29538.1 hypothetical protein SD074_17400 [Prolixibacter sp. SD074]
MAKVLILTTENAARSQMLEGWLRYYTRNNVVVQSAGLTSCAIDPFAVKAMIEAVVDIREAKSKILGKLDEIPFDQIITLTPLATSEAMSKYPTATVEEAIFDDPKLATGEEKERLKIYRRSVDEIDDYAFNYAVRKLGLEF